MDEHPNAVWARKMLDAMNSSPESAAELVADDIEWHEIGRAEPIIGKQALAERFGMGGGTAPDFEITAEVHDVIANDDHTVALLSAHATRGGKTLDYRVAEIYHIRDGKLAKRWAFSDDTEAITEFFA